MLILCPKENLPIIVLNALLWANSSGAVGTRILVVSFEAKDGGMILTKPNFRFLDFVVSYPSTTDSISDEINKIVDSKKV